MRPLLFKETIMRRIAAASFVLIIAAALATLTFFARNVLNWL